MEHAITYQEFRLSLCDILSMERLTILEEVNEHSTMSLTALLEGALQEDVIHELGEEVILYSFVEKKLTPLFYGVMTEIKVILEGNSYYLFVEAKSQTYKMDVGKKSRSFQNKAMTSHALINSVMEGYQKQSHISCVKNTPIGKLILQYEETDWEFLKRVLSNYQESIYVENGFDGICYYAGIPDRKKKVDWEEQGYYIQKEIEDYNALRENSSVNIGPMSIL